LLVGRDPRCDIVLRDVTVSRRHARLICRDGAWIVQDLGSTNGTAVNGVAVGRCELRPGDRLCVGDTVLWLD
jgi:pSer/pThr/pTyr-binding forkhead associated (FHA) protein